MRGLRRYVLCGIVVSAMSAMAQQVMSVEPDTLVQRPDTLRCDTLRCDTLALDSLSSDTLNPAALAAVGGLVAEPLATPKVKKTFLERLGGFGRFIKRAVDAFNDIDSNYVEPIHYNFTAMGQMTTNFERYVVSSSDYDAKLTFAQHPDLRIGPYFGWRWLFFGYTYDLTSLGKTRHKRGDKIEFSLYSSVIGVDLIWRRTGSDFYLKSVSGLGEEAKAYEGETFDDYIRTNMMGVNIYYVFNHRKFSHPAIYSQSTIQRRSAGSWQLGASLTFHDIHFDYDALPKSMFSELNAQNQYASLELVKYFDASITFGYAYNWVFHRGWCLGISLLPAIGYKRASTQTAVFEEPEGQDASGAEHPSYLSEKIDDIFRKRGNLNFNVTGRLGLIYNTGRWFTGLFGIVHNYNYRRDDIRFTNVFGTVNVCGGFYFQKRKN